MGAGFRPPEGACTETAGALPPLFVGFAGAAGVGKTTLVEELAEHFHAVGNTVEKVSEVARDVFRLYSTAGEALSLDELRDHGTRYIQFQKDIFDMMVAKEERALTGGADLVLCDRTVWDNWLYALLYTTRRDGKLFDILAARVAHYLKEPKYNLVVYLPPHGKKVAEDEGRAREDSESQAVQDTLLRMLIGSAGGRLLEVKAQDPRERFGYLAYLIGEWLRSRTGKNA